MTQENKISEFENALLPHLDAAYNLARWLVRNDADADDIVQESYLRAFRSFGGFRGGGSELAWTLKIVRNVSYSWLQKNRSQGNTDEFDEEIHSAESCDPETILIQKIDRRLLRQFLDELPVEFREIVILRELEGLSYKEIAGITELPLGTVMSRLARARRRLQSNLSERSKGASK